MPSSLSLIRSGAGAAFGEPAVRRSRARHCAAVRRGYPVWTSHDALRTAWEWQRASFAQTVGPRMSIHRSTDRILTTHVGSLARPRDVLDMMKAKVAGAAHDSDAYEQRI